MILLAEAEDITAPEVAKGELDSSTGPVEIACRDMFLDVVEYRLADDFARPLLRRQNRETGDGEADSHAVVLGHLEPCLEVCESVLDHLLLWPGFEVFALLYQDRHLGLERRELFLDLVDEAITVGNSRIFYRCLKRGGQCRDHQHHRQGRKCCCQARPPP